MTDRVSYSPAGVREMRAYRSHVQKLVDDGHLSQREADVLVMSRMQGIITEAQTGLPVRRPRCSSCGTIVPVLGAAAQTFRCSCSPAIEQSVADGVRSRGNEPTPT